MPKKILVFLASPFFLPKGSSLRVFSNVSSLARLGHSVTVLSYAIGERVSSPHIRVLHPRFLFWYRKTSPGPSFLKAIADVFLFCSGFWHLLWHRKHYDLLWGEDVEGSFLGVVLAKIFRKPFVSDMHNSLENTLLPYTKRRSIHFLAKKIDSFLEKKSKYITTAWEYDAIRLQKQYPKKRILFLPESFHTSSQNRISFPFPFLLYAGNFESYQGISFFLDAFFFFCVQYQSDIHFVLIGKETPEVRQIVQENILASRVHFMGLRSVEDTGSFMKHALFCVIPRVVDGPPSMKAMHYFSCGKSILATNLSCNEKVIRHNETGFLVSPSREAMVNGIATLVQNEQLRLSLEKNVRQKAIGTEKKTDKVIEILLQSVFLK